MFALHPFAFCSFSWESQFQYSCIVAKSINRAYFKKLGVCNGGNKNLKSVLLYTRLYRASKHSCVNSDN